MALPELPNKPLVEAIFEARWRLIQASKDNPATKVDPHYKLLPGRVFDRLRDDYPHYESLPQASLPEELTPHTVHHRYRVAPNDWPLVQLGPGVFAVNDTAKYKWESFSSTCERAFTVLREAYPEPKDLTFENLMLRYIDAIKILEHDPQDVYVFMRDLLHVTVDIPEALFNDVVQPPAHHLRWQTAFPTTVPPGMIMLAITTGEVKGEKALIMETSIQTSDDGLASFIGSKEGMREWLEKAHALASIWFHTLTEGELHRRFEQHDTGSE